jgi:hypothetical protein
MAQTRRRNKPQYQNPGRQFANATPTSRPGQRPGRRVRRRPNGLGAGLKVRPDQARQFGLHALTQALRNRGVNRTSPATTGGVAPTPGNVANSVPSPSPVTGTGRNAYQGVGSQGKGQGRIHGLGLNKVGKGGHARSAAITALQERIRENKQKSKPAKPGQSGSQGTGADAGVAAGSVVDPITGETVDAPALPGDSGNPGNVAKPGEANSKPSDRNQKLIAQLNSLKGDRAAAIKRIQKRKKQKQQ